MSEIAAWGIFLAPLASFALIALVIRPFFNRCDRLSGYVTVLAMVVSLALSVGALQAVMAGDGKPLEWRAESLGLSVGPLTFIPGVYLDPLTAVMVVVVSLVSLMVQVYSLGYMKDDPGYSRYFAYMSLFTASMLGLVLARNLLQLYVFWEMVGLCSYLLIGFWYNRPAAAAAAKKAFLVTRLGDFGFLLAILYLFFHQGVFAVQGMNALEIPDIHEAARTGLLATGVVTWVALGVFVGAMGKSGQFPLHTWLPDAMEGPTPVSSLIHAATMVAAGVFLVARMFPLYEASSAAMNTVAIIGGFTALFAATMGLVANDVKRVLAYSTISQLGYMMMGLGVGAYGAAIFHLLTHGLFKCLLFLGVGSANHATGTFDMRYMGGLRKRMPVTYVTFLVAALSLAGVFPLAGFWSKDEILAAAFHGGSAVSLVVFLMGAAAVFLTAVYIFRAVFMTFHGEFRGGAETDPMPPPGEHHVHLAESPWVMVAPMVALAVGSVVAGFLMNPVAPLWGLGIAPAHWLSEFLEGHAVGMDLGVAGLSTLLAASGIGLAYLLYGARRVSPDAVAQRVRPLYTLVSRRYYFDELYEEYVVTRVWYQGLCNALEWVDRNIVDGFMDFVGWQGRNWGAGIARLQTGQLQLYGVVFASGIIVIMAAFLLWG
ncbi:MAG: NADH-quinone oxidoreductase subunit L [Dehalococcoidia bacterium]|nr:NADH-quinone oxidoreductase subunit L [Dehalococcoidia bacterium]